MLLLVYTILLFINILPNKYYIVLIVLHVYDIYPHVHETATEAYNAIFRNWSLTTVQKNELCRRIICTHVYNIT